MDVALAVFQIATFLTSDAAFRSILSAVRCEVVLGADAARSTHDAKNHESRNSFGFQSGGS
jgi:hypothetical protein